MKFTSIDIYTNDVLDFNINFKENTNTSPYILKSAEGLDADSIRANFYAFSSTRAKQYFNLKPTKREIQLTIVLDPRFNLGDSYDLIRDNIYRAIYAARDGQVDLRFKDGNIVVARIKGFVSKLEGSRFNRSNEFVMYIYCPNPMFTAMNRTSLSGAQLGPQNRAVINDTISTAPTGAQFSLEFTQSTNKFWMGAVDSEWYFHIVPDVITGSTVGFIAGDKLYFSSETDNKYLYVVRNNTTYHLADRLQAGSNWPIIFPGNNVFTIDAAIPAPSSWVYNWISVNWLPTFWGF